MCGVEGEAGLAGSTGTDNGDDPSPIEQIGDRLELLVAADEGRDRQRWKPVGARLVHEQLGLLVEDLALHASQRGRRLKPELLHESDAMVLEALQPLGAAAGRVQRPQQQRHRSLTERILHQQGFDRREARVGPPGRELGLREHLDRLAAQLADTNGYWLHGRVVGGIGERLAVPPRQHRAQLIGPTHRRRRVGDGVLEAPRVDLAAVEREAVTADVTDQRAGVSAEHVSNPRELCLQCLPRMLRQRFAPGRVDEHVRRNGPAAGRGEHRQDPPLPGRGNRPRLAVVVDPRRPKNPQHEAGLPFEH